MRKIALLLFLLFNISLNAQKSIEGIVLDSATHEVLPFVNITLKGTTTGTVTALNGKFSLSVPSLPITLVCSFVGYRKKEIIITQEGFKKIELVNVGFNLNEAVVVAGPNPADLIMKKVVEHSTTNNPEKNCRFEYVSYNKLLFTIDQNYLNKSVDSTDKDAMGMFNFFNKQHIFLSESVTQKKYYSANKNKETVVAAKVSGFSSPVFTLLSTQLQSFHFYKEEFSLSDIKFIGPVSNYGLKHYHFILADTFYLGADTVYSITFSPHKPGNKHSMQGVLQIHTDGYAIYNVKASPVSEQASGMGISISQQYQKVENKQWFPVELNTVLSFGSEQMKDFPLVGIGTGIITEIKINPEFDKKEFDNVEVEMDEEALKNSDSQLEKYRIDTLNKKEKETYRVIDSLGEAHHLDKKMLAINSLIEGSVPIKFLDWDITQLLNYNDYEGLRLGLGLKTNYRLVKWASVGGYLAYGFKDKAFKYGYNANITFNKKNQTAINFSYKNDVEASSGSTFFESPRLLMNQGYANLFLSRFDSISKYETRFSTRALKHFKFHLFANYQVRESFENYIYRFPISNEVTLLDQTFTLAEYGFEFKMAINEKFIETPFGYISKGTKWPIVSFRYTKGVSGILNSEYDYDRFIFKTEKTFSSIRWGNFSVALSGGMVVGETPYHLLFNPTGTYKPIEKLTVYSVDGFETIHNNEFLLDRFLSGHFKYRLPQPLVKAKKFRPYLSLTTTGLLGNLDNSQIHQNLTYSSINKPYFESGILIDNILHSGVTAIGVGGFYRWGAYSFPTFKENFALKISIAIALE